MKNLILFVVTVCVYAGAYGLFADPQGFAAVKAVGIIALLALPLNIKGDVFTLIGNAESEKSIYALCSLYQRAKQDAVSIIGLANYQCAGDWAVTIAGLTLYQQSHDAVTYAGLTVCQRADDDAGLFVGLSFLQFANSSATVIIGFAFCQCAKTETGVLAGCALYQRVGMKSRVFGAFSNYKNYRE